MATLLKLLAFLVAFVAAALTFGLDVLQWIPVWKCVIGNVLITDMPTIIALTN